MIPKECKRLAEVDFPIAEVSRHAAREKSIRHGHPSTLHLWWARRPLASCRAVLLALLWPDPCDQLCPEEFKEKACKLLPQVPNCNPGMTDQELRRALLKFIADFANWDVASNRTYLDVSRALVKAAHGDEPPLVVDPFAGGGSIPLEALRVGCETFASDLNPVACLILKVMLEDIPRNGQQLAEELRRVGFEIKRQAEKELADLYPKDPDGATPIAYLWARTVRCESPNCGAEMPLMRSFWLCKKANRKRALRYRVLRPKGEPPHVVFELFEPKAEKEVPHGTVTRAKAACPCCGAVLAPERVRAQLAAQRGGADMVFDAEGRRMGGARMLAVVLLKPGETGRHYRLPEGRDYKALRAAQARVAKMLEEWESYGRQGLCPVPDESLPPVGTLGFRVQRYGMLKWGDLFTSRQKLALCTLAGLIRKKAESFRTLGDLLALTLNHTTERCSSLCRWSPEAYMETILGVFGRQALPMIWDFAEPAILSDSTGSFLHGLEVKAQAVASAPVLPYAGDVELADARHSPLPDNSAAVWFTDPPYYDAVPYSDLSDFFFVWLKRAILRDHFRDPFDANNPLTPKSAEIVQDETRVFEGEPKNRAFFESQMAIAFKEGDRILHENGIGSVVFAHKTTEGWEALLSGLVSGGWVITGSWPIATERPNRLRSRDSAALATSVHLVCRPRPEDAPIGDWADVLRELPKRVGDWMERLQGEGVRGADLVFACIGPALEIFSRYAKVETADGREVSLAEYLEKVWEVVGRSALAQVLGTADAKARNGAAGALEEDARLTALFLWTLQSTSSEVPMDTGDENEGEEEFDEEEEEDTSGGKAKGFTLVFDVVRRFAQPLGIDLPKWEGRIIKTNKGVVRLLPVKERAQQLFGQDGAAGLAARIERAPQTAAQLELFPAVTEIAPPKAEGRRKRAATAAAAPSGPVQATTLDRVHAAMLLQAGGSTNALRELLKAEQERGSDFQRLANALSALYPNGCEEKRLLDAMLLAVPR